MCASKTTHDACVDWRPGCCCAAGSSSWPWRSRPSSSCSRAACAARRGRRCRRGRVRLATGRGGAAGVGARPVVRSPGGRHRHGTCGRDRLGCRVMTTVSIPEDAAPDVAPPARRHRDLLTVLLWLAVVLGGVLSRSRSVFDRLSSATDPAPGSESQQARRSLQAATGERDSDRSPSSTAPARGRTAALADRLRQLPGVHRVRSSADRQLPPPTGGGTRSRSGCAPAATDRQVNTTVDAVRARVRPAPGRARSLVGGYPVVDRELGSTGPRRPRPRRGCRAADRADPAGLRRAQRGRRAARAGTGRHHRHRRSRRAARAERGDGGVQLRGQRGHHVRHRPGRGLRPARHHPVPARTRRAARPSPTPSPRTDGHQRPHRGAVRPDRRRRAGRPAACSPNRSCGPWPTAASARSRSPSRRR